MVGDGAGARALLVATAMLLSLTGRPTDGCQRQTGDWTESELVWPQKLPLSSVSDLDSNTVDTGPPPGSTRHLHYRLRAFGRELQLRLWPDHGEMVVPQLRVQAEHRNFSEIHGLGADTRRCFYVGVVRDDPGSHVALSLCKGMTGHIRTSEGSYLIWPSEEAPQSTTGAHHLQRYPTAPLGSAQDDDFRRSRRSTSEPYYVEVMVAADSKMAKYHGTQLKQYILALMSTVSRIYKDPSIGNSITISVVRIVLIDEDVLDANKQASWKNGKSASAVLHRFCKWQQTLNDPDVNSQAHFDTAVLLTRENICRNSLQCDTLGLAELGTMCDPRSSCSIVQDNGLSAAFTVAHELGHVLNIPHDDDVKCKPHMGQNKTEYAMSRMLNHDTHPWAWSNCSRHFFTEYLQGDHGRCLKNKPSASVSAAIGELRQRATEEVTQVVRHPGETYNASQQCQFLFGTSDKHFKVCPYMPVCKRLWCTTGAEEDGCRTQHMPWADRTTCAPRKWCLKGECVPKESRPAVHGGWGQWSPWGSCSRSCGGGIRRSRRECNYPTPSNGGDYCLGQRVRYESCNRQDCPPHDVDFREAQCTSFNGNNFNIKGLPATVQWVPKYTGIKSQDRCKLFCRVSDSSAYYLLKERVEDGTPCTPDTDDMCVNGVCMPAGCDHVLASSVRSDLCGVCGGDNSTCRVVRQQFDSSSRHVVYGYNLVATIPAGATRLVVEQSSHDHTSKDDNYLALRSPSSGLYILNGNFVVSMFQKVFQFGGALVEYSGSDSVTEKINCTKRLEENLEIYVLSVGSLHPPNIDYEYVVSLQPTSDTYRWQMTENWSECDRICQGSQYLVPECVRSSDLAQVSEEQCPVRTRPASQDRRCNTECQLKWGITHQSECSAECGEGVRKNAVRCFQKFRHVRLGVRPVADDHCGHLSDRPPHTESCRGPCLHVRWAFGDWSQCSSPCGGGTQERTAKCTGRDGQEVGARFCNQSTLPVQQSCNTQPCPQWRTGDWAECSSMCGEGRRQRPVWCSQQDKAVPESHCDLTQMPSKEEKCHSKPCPEWSKGDWGECSVSCGAGIMVRQVTCMSSENISLNDSACGGPRPALSRRCMRPPCPTVPATPTEPVTTELPPSPRPRLRSKSRRRRRRRRRRLWLTGQWSKCSRSCGDGLQTRSVTCVDRRSKRRLHRRACRRQREPASSQSCRGSRCGEWKTSEWTRCSSSCGKGIQRREVTCISPNAIAPLPSDQCDPGSKPVPQQSCRSHARCPSDEPQKRQWIRGAWGPCSRSCGGGVRRRTVLCLDSSSKTMCDSRGRPNRTEACNEQPCPGWHAGHWGQCSVSCGSGTRRRRVQCQSEAGSQADHHCPPAERPEETEPCHQPACPIESLPVAAALRSERRPVGQPFKWEVAAWSKCSRSCGAGVQHRPVTCRRAGAADGPAAPDSACPQGERPPASRRCYRACHHQFRWRPEHWTKCSRTCGPDGFRYRKVRCVDLSGKPVHRRKCARTKRPTRRRRCNRRPCGPTSCAEVRSRSHHANDGNYQLFIAGRNVTIYCHDMNGPEPVEFITLPVEKHRRRHSNFAEIDPKRLIQAHTCPYNGSRVRPARCDLCVRSRSSHAGLTVFKRVRLNTTSLHIMPWDFTFSRQLRGRRVNFGEAGDCYSTAGCPQGRFSINLAGTGFRLASGLTWVGVGREPSVHVNIDQSRMSVQGRCGGYCGTCQASSAPDGIRLELAPS
ncbi:A disintegrin and metalloproteinase with thrombospondin motifs 20-like isoform X2 [Amphibalanus amphitrite]|uniref:A disintegrin and metalloproteinase with thrombospondin motifs 20-like isoform X2 n=2 Tax=Amphibalanus amphitrite TaxID=1232801 RepID=UPI001C90C814|nr:A disintegrin and metalloproteinase with thrombospondin motifs 20-like isoform X2 [Amphibalanus amphitrite]